MSGRFSDPLDRLVVPIVLRFYAEILNHDNKRVKSDLAQKKGHKLLKTTAAELKGFAYTSEIKSNRR